MAMVNQARRLRRMRVRTAAGRASGLVLAAGLAGCGPFLSESGPSRETVVMQAATTVSAPAPPLPYVLVPVNAATLPALSTPPGQPSFRVAAAGRERSGTIGVGDDLGVTIFESAPGGLFITDHPENQTGNSVTLPSQQVDSAGSIVIPYGGAVPVVDRTPSEVEREIVRRLAGRALDPQVVVTILNRRAGTINVVGDVAGAARFSLEPGGETLLGAIARAGGPRFPAYETTVTLQRGGTTQKGRLSQVVEQPDQNLALMPGDTIYLSHDADFFLALGATGQATSLGPLDRRIAFGGATISLADALAKAGGLEDDRANAQACFVYRLNRKRDGQVSTTVPTIYLLNLRDPAGFFYASKFVMNPEDAIFVSNAPMTDLAKFLSLILPVAYSSSGFRAGFN